MKKSIFLALFIIACTMYSRSETYCYKYLYQINRHTEVKRNPNNGHRLSFITFNSNKSTCYFSDEDGVKKSKSSGMYGYGSTSANEKGYNEFYYVGEQNGMYIYRETVTSYIYSPYEGALGGYAPMYSTYRYLYFSTDFQRMNMWEDPNYDTSATPAYMKQYLSMLPSRKDISEYVSVYERSTPPSQESAPTQLW